MKAILIVLSVITFTSTSAQKDLVKNGGFEMDLVSWRGADIATISAFEKKQGNKSCVINQFVGSDWKGIDQVLYIPKKTFAVEVGMWIKAGGIEGGKEAYNAGVGIFEFLNSGGKSIKNENIAQVVGTTDWTYYSKLLEVPENTRKARIMLALAQTNGTVFFDDISVAEVSEQDYLKRTEQSTAINKAEFNSETAITSGLQNGNFNKGVNYWTGSGVVKVDAKGSENSYITIHSNTEDWKAIDQIGTIAEGVKSLRFSGRLKAENIQQGKEVWNNGMYIVEFTTNGIEKVTADQVIGSVTGSTDWTFFEKVLEVPEGAKKYRVMLALSACKGTLLADDIEVKMEAE